MKFDKPHHVMGRSPNYIGTIRVSHGNDYFFLKSLRDAVRVINAISTGEKFRVCLQGRLGKNSPYAEIYRQRARTYDGVGAYHYQRIKLRHCATADVYIYAR